MGVVSSPLHYRARPPFRCPQRNQMNTHHMQTCQNEPRQVQLHRKCSKSEREHGLLDRGPHNQ